MSTAVARRPLTIAALIALLASVLVGLLPQPVVATPVAVDDSTYGALGRVFPDPHACLEGVPTKSPEANGNVCAAQFIQWDEAIEGLQYLASKYPRYIQVLNLENQFGHLPEFTEEELRSAGIPREDLSREQRPLYVVKLTDRDSATTPDEADRRHFVFSLSIHGIERAGLEGGLRAAEDLATWAACENGDAPAEVDCGTEGSSPETPRRLLDPYDDDGRSPTAGQALADGVLLFTLSNPDGWARGDYSQGGVFYQRYNGNGMDLNRDWPTVGYSDEAYTSWSEPETRGFGRWLKWVSDETTSDGHFAGGIDLHGMVTANSLSYTLLGAGQKDYRKNAITVDTAELMWRDAEERLTWSPHVARAEDCPGPVPEPFFGQDRTTAPMCTVQWGTVWDTIEYQITGGMGDWIDNPDIGLGGVGINNEMALSHLAPNNIFEPDIVQLQIEGNKSLIYSQVTSLLYEDEVAFEPAGRIAWIDDPSRVSSDGEDFVVPPELRNLPTQDDIEGVELTGAQGFEFEVEGPGHGYFNGGLTVEATYTNIRGISAGSVAPLVLEYCGPAEGEEAHLTHQHAHEHEAWAEATSDGECREVARYFNQAPTYLQGGAQIELNRPQPGLYRVRPEEGRVLPTAMHIRFRHGDAIPGWDDQAPYDVSRTDFFRDLNAYVRDSGQELVPVTVDEVLADPEVLRTFDSVVVADRFMPGEWDGPERDAYAGAFQEFVAAGGNLVLTDGAVTGLPDLGTGIDADAIDRGVYYAGYIDFNDGTEPTFDRHPLTADIARDGTASGRQTLNGVQYYDRRQTYEPVPMGYLVGGPSTCSSGCDAPIWTIAADDWETAGGLHLGRSFVRQGPDDSASWDGVTLGELPLGDGVVRVIGALLPEPTQDNFHPYGLASYGLTYTGYQLFENATAWDNPGRQEPPPPDPDPDPDDPAEGVAVTCVDCEITVRAGETGSADLEVVNTGDTEQRFVLAAEVPDRWEATVTPSEVTLPAGEAADVTLEVTPHRSAKGTHDVTILGEAVDGEAADQAIVEVEVAKGPPSQRGPDDRGPDHEAMSAARAVDPTGPAAALLLGAVLMLGLTFGSPRMRARPRG